MNTELIAAELQQITIILEQITGISSNWNGTVQLVPDAAFRGKKPFTCSIEIDALLAQQELRWRTLIHEAIHALSAGYIRAAYMDNVGWEEGVVEKLQRLLRQEILRRLNVVVEEAIFVAAEAEQAYNEYIDALEDVRRAAGIENEVEFYLGLLKTPIKERYTSLIKSALQQPSDQRKQMLTILSAAHATLKEMPL